MPFLFPIETRQSTIKGAGIGLFACADIPLGVTITVFSCENPAPVFGFEALQNRLFNKEQLQAIAAVSPEQVRVILHGGFYFADNDLFVDMRDGSQFLNHSQDSNIVVVYPTSKDYRQLKCITTRPIKKGEEILDAYEEFPSEDSEWVTALMQKICPERIGFQRSLKQKK